MEIDFWVLNNREQQIADRTSILSQYCLYSINVVFSTTSLGFSSINFIMVAIKSSRLQFHTCVYIYTYICVFACTHIHKENLGALNITNYVELKGHCGNVCYECYFLNTSPVNKIVINQQQAAICSKTDSVDANLIYN